MGRYVCHMYWAHTKDSKCLKILMTEKGQGHLQIKATTRTWLGARLHHLSRQFIAINLATDKHSFLETTQEAETREAIYFLTGLKRDQVSSHLP